jgi:translation elongation factor EF-G
MPFLATPRTSTALTNAATARYKNKGVQVLLDAISAYLPSPYEKANEALDTAADEAKVVSESEAAASRRSAVEEEY